MICHTTTQGNIVEFSKEKKITTVSDWLDTIMEASQFSAIVMIVYEESLPDAFFHLSTGLAGEMLQKSVTYQMPVAIIGNFDAYQSTSLRDFIRESNRGSQIFFLNTVQEAMEKIASL